MKSYNLDTIFTFGKWRGDTLGDVFEAEPEYIEWCIQNRDDFYLGDEVIEELEEIHPEFTFSDKSIEILEGKLMVMGSDQSYNDYANTRGKASYNNDLDWD